MTYILEKTFELTCDFQIIPYTYGHIYIRPCEWNYKKCLAFWAGKLDKNIPITFLGSCAVYNDVQHYYKSLEEWLINLELERNITPDFEEHILIDRYSKYYDTYIIKIINRHNGKIIEDNIEKVISHLKNQR